MGLMRRRSSTRYSRPSRCPPWLTWFAASMALILRRWPLTRTGAGTLGLAAGTYALAAILDYRILAAIAVGLVTLVMFAAIWMIPWLRISVTRSVSPDRLQVGEVAQGQLTVQNRSSLP